MGEELATSVSTHFSDSSDPRSGENISHSLLNIITITICAVICGADNWVDIEQFGKAKQSWLDTFLDMPHGVPSQDTLGRIFRRIDPEAFQQRFQEWTQTSSELMGGEVIAIDGKQRRRSKDKALGKAGIYMVSAWASDNNLVLAQQKVDDKSNAITAIPMLLKLLDIADMVVTMDAMGCQTAIVEQIIDQGGDYLIAVKENQGTLYENIQSLFETDHLVATADYHRTVNGGHGRIEIRECWAIDDPDALAYITDYKAWKQLGSVINVVSERRLPDKTEIETRFCISSLPANAALLLDKAIPENKVLVFSPHPPHRPEG